MEILKERILMGDYNLNTLIPTETELEKEFNVSKITVRKAIDLLENEGFVAKKGGYGTKVISNGLYNTLTGSGSFSNTIDEEGYAFRKEGTKITTIKLNPQDEMYQYFEAVCYKITRKYFLDGKPYIYYTLFTRKYET